MFDACTAMTTTAEYPYLVYKIRFLQTLLFALRYRERQKAFNNALSTIDDAYQEVLNKRQIELMNNKFLFKHLFFVYTNHTD